MTLRGLSVLGITGVLALLSSCSGGSKPNSEASNGAASSPLPGADGETKGTAAPSPASSKGDGEVAGAYASADAVSSIYAAPPVPAASGATPASSGGAESSAPITSTASSSASAPAASGSSAGVATDVPEVVEPASPQQLPAGILTAGAWDDNRNLDRFLSFRSDLENQQLSGLLDFSADDHQSAEPLGTPVAHTTLDVSLVIDTTGSMGDELGYLQSEFAAISTQIEASYPNAQQRWSLVLYRDQGDEYVTRWFGFRADLADFQSHLAAQSAGGGGDFPEAADQGLATMTQLDWRTGSDTARLAFWLADAPHHADKAAAMQAAIVAAQSQGVHIYPVASSGIDDFTELTMRSAAQLTGGRYLFLTNDSGVGNSHKEPSIPCYFVTKLDDAILRMVDIEMTGVYREPAAAQILRTGGDPQDGACALASGQTVFVF